MIKDMMLCETHKLCESNPLIGTCAMSICCNITEWFRFENLDVYQIQGCR